MVNAMSGFEAERPIRELSGIPKKRKIDLLTKGIPGLIKDANMGCKMAVKQYIHIAEGQHWKEVSSSLEEYLVTYWEKSPAWFESLKSIVQASEKGANYTKPLEAAAKNHGGDRKSDEYINQVANSHLKPLNKLSSDSPERLMRAMARDCPEVLDEIGKGKKYKSVRAAAIAMGKVKPKVTIQFPPEESGSQIAGRLYQKLTPQQFNELRESLNEFPPLED